MKYNNIMYGPFFSNVRITLVYSLIRLFKTSIFSHFSIFSCTVCFFLFGKSFEVVIVESRPVFVTNYIRELKLLLLLRRRPQLQETIGLMIKTTALHVDHDF